MRQRHGDWMCCWDWIRGKRGRRRHFRGEEKYRKTLEKRQHGATREHTTQGRKGRMRRNTFLVIQLATVSDCAVSMSMHNLTNETCAKQDLLAITHAYLSMQISLMLRAIALKHLGVYTHVSVSACACACRYIHTCVFQWASEVKRSLNLYTNIFVCVFHIYVYMYLQILIYVYYTRTCSKQPLVWTQLSLQCKSLDCRLSKTHR